MDWDDPGQRPMLDSATAQLPPIAGLAAFLNEKVDVVVDSQPLERRLTPFRE